jgi:methylenetetrahydrofolate reductase (NADPH)
MRLRTFFGTDRLGLSFELFPPKTAEGERSLFRHVAQLMELRPGFITCTYGAGGSTRDKTLEIVDRVKQKHGLPVATHLTCVGSTVEQLRVILAEAQRRGIDYVVALRGDPPQGQTEFQPMAGGLRHASELVGLIRQEFPKFGVAVAGYPEKHREAADAETDLRNLRHKVDAGADVVLTQLFYDNDVFLRFRERCVHAGIRVPIVPGLLPITSLSQIQRITALCGATLPPALVSDLARSEQEDWQFRVGVEFATRQVERLISSGVPGLHFYVLNKSQATKAVFEAVSGGR